jgi:hypothetical protein
MSTVVLKKNAKRVLREAKPLRKIRAKLAPIPQSSPLHGHDDLIGCVSIDVPATSAKRRALIAERIHADNHR